MDTHQIAQEIRDLNDKTDRQEAALDTIGCHLGQLRERDIPAATASISHTLAGTQHLQANLAATVHILAAQLHDVSARLTLVERCVDHDCTPQLDPV